MNEEQNGTISADGSIVLQILNRSEPLSNIAKICREASLFLISRFLFVTVLIDGIERTRETVTTSPVLQQISFITRASFSFLLL